MSEDWSHGCRYPVHSLPDINPLHSQSATSNLKQGNQYRKSFAFNSGPTGFQLTWKPVRWFNTRADSR